MKKPNVRLWVAACLLPIALFAGCKRVDTTKLPPEVLSPGGTAAATMETPPNRFEVVRVQRFNDALAYGGERGVYVIRDLRTGKEFIGVSGVGISELGSHYAGKARLSDER